MTYSRRVRVLDAFLLLEEKASTEGFLVARADGFPQVMVRAHAAAAAAKLARETPWVAVGEPEPLNDDYGVITYRVPMRLVAGGA